MESLEPFFQIDSDGALMRRYYFHTEVLELRRSMIVLEKNTLLRVTYAIIVYTNTRLETVPIPSEVLFTTSSTFKIKQNQIRSNKHEQDNTNDHFESFSEQYGHLCRKFKTIIRKTTIFNSKFPFLSQISTQIFFVFP